jgi:hypothetical protein
MTKDTFLYRGAKETAIRKAKKQFHKKYGRDPKSARAIEPVANAWKVEVSDSTDEIEDMLKEMEEQEKKTPPKKTRTRGRGKR